MKLIQTKDYLLLIDEEAEVSKTGTLIYENDTTLLNITDVDYKPHELDSKIIAYYPLIKEAKELDLPLLPNPFKDELKELINKFNANYNRRGEYYLGLVDGTKLGYKAAQSKQFSLKDMKDILEEGLNWFGGGRDKEIRDSETWFNHYIQSLSNKQLPKFFIPEENYGDGALTKYKTIINSESKEELVGTYKY